MMSFRLSDVAELRLRRMSEEAGKPMTQLVESGIEVLWALRAPDEEIVNAFGAIERHMVPQWNPFSPPAECFTFNRHCVTLGDRVYQMQVEACPPSVTSMEWAIKIYAQYFRGIILAINGASAPFAVGPISGIAHHMGFDE